MGIRPYKAFTYDGKSSLDYGVYLTGKGVFNAPERAVEMIEIPGRNGNFAVDQGRFQNISVTYKAGLVDYSESDFATRMSNVRNWLCSKVGYRRLEDDYNTGEYRMAVYLSGIEVEHEDLQTGEFEITFDCKPQRFLTSGETAVSVANNGTINNPTLFDAKPQLQVKGYGTIGFNGYSVTLANESMGNIIIAENSSSISCQQNTMKVMQTLPTGYYNSGDTLTLIGSKIQFVVNASAGGRFLDTYTATNSQTGYTTTMKPYDPESGPDSLRAIRGVTSVPDITFMAGTYKQVTNTTTANCTLRMASDVAVTVTVAQTIEYSPSKNAISVRADITITTTSPYVYSGGSGYTLGTLYADSSVSILGNPTYLDCELGEAYKIVNNSIVSLNQFIDIGAELPCLAAGTNTFTYNNTITELKVVPNWWKV